LWQQLDPPFCLQLLPVPPVVWFSCLYHSTFLSVIHHKSLEKQIQV
jgi:hypothetical protein